MDPKMKASKQETKLKLPSLQIWLKASTPVISTTLLFLLLFSLITLSSLVGKALNLLVQCVFITLVSAVMSHLIFKTLHFRLKPIKIDTFLLPWLFEKFPFLSRLQELGQEEINTEWINNLSNFIVDEYIVKSWYCYIGQDQTFPNECNLVIRQCLSNIATRVSQVDFTSLLNDVTLITHRHLKKVAISKMRHSKFQAEHPVMKGQCNIDEYVESQVDLLLKAFLPKYEHQQKSLSANVLKMVIKKTIQNKLNRSEPQQKNEKEKNIEEPNLLEDLSKENIINKIMERPNVSSSTFNY